MYSIDWMQVYCVSRIHNYDYKSLMGQKKISPECNRFGYHNEYVFLAAKEIIVGYEEQFMLVYKNYTVATIAAVPRDKKKHPDGCAIKIANPVLYTTQWYDFLHDIATMMQWDIHNITRVDLAADFNFFHHGLHPLSFIRRYIMKGKNGYVKVGTNRYSLNGERELHTNRIDTIRWGSRQSGVSTYLYNKTKELNDKKDKPWIREAWKKAQLKPNDVWRLEFSITNQGTNLKDITNGMLKSLFHDDLSTQESVESYFYVYAAKYFHFKYVEIAERGQPQKSKQNMKDVILFSRYSDREPTEYLKPITPTSIKETGKTDKVVMNRLAQELEFLMATDDENKYTIARQIVNFKKYAESRYSVKKKAADNENSIKQLTKKYSMDYLYQRLGIAFRTRQNNLLVDEIATNIAEVVMQKYGIYQNETIAVD